MEKEKKKEKGENVKKRPGRELEKYKEKKRMKKN